MPFIEVRGTRLFFTDEGTGSAPAVDPGYLVADEIGEGMGPFVRAMTRSQSVAWEGAGHWLHQERPEEFNHLVETWLASLVDR